MNELDIKLSPQGILDKEFNYDAKGYRPREVDAFLDDVISDYNEFLKCIKSKEKEKKDLIEENNMLKNELRKLKLEIESIKETSEMGKFTSNNIDLLRRISNLEKIVYGKNDEE